jgi:hypothetical protein
MFGGPIQFCTVRTDPTRPTSDRNVRFSTGHLVGAARAHPPTVHSQKRAPEKNPSVRYSCALARPIHRTQVQAGHGKPRLDRWKHCGPIFLLAFPPPVVHSLPRLATQLPPSHVAHGARPEPAGHLPRGWWPLPRASWLSLSLTRGRGGPCTHSHVVPRPGRLAWSPSMRALRHDRLPARRTLWAFP